MNDDETAVMPAVVRSVEGVFTIMRSKESRDCSCCKGDHVFAYGVELPDEPPAAGVRGPTVARPADWLARVLYPLREQIDGWEVHIVVTIEPVGEGQP